MTRPEGGRWWCGGSAARRRADPRSAIGRYRTTRRCRRVDASTGRDGGLGTTAGNVEKVTVGATVAPALNATAAAGAALMSFGFITSGTIPSADDAPCTSDCNWRAHWRADPESPVFSGF